MAKEKSISNGTMAAVGVGVGAAAVGAAAAYWFYGAKNAVGHRKTAQSWMIKARGDVLEAVDVAIKNMGQLDKEKYMEIVDGILGRYSKLAGVKSAEVLQMTKDMKEAWQRMQTAGKKSGPTAKGASKKKKL